MRPVADQGHHMQTRVHHSSNNALHSTDGSWHSTDGSWPSCNTTAVNCRMTYPRDTLSAQSRSPCGGRLMGGGATGCGAGGATGGGCCGGCGCGIAGNVEGGALPLTIPSRTCACRPGSTSHMPFSQAEAKARALCEPSSGLATLPPCP